MRLPRTWKNHFSISAPELLNIISRYCHWAIWTSQLFRTYLLLDASVLPSAELLMSCQQLPKQRWGCACPAGSAAEWVFSNGMVIETFILLTGPETNNLLLSWVLTGYLHFHRFWNELLKRGPPAEVQVGNYHGEVPGWDPEGWWAVPSSPTGSSQLRQVLASNSDAPYLPKKNTVFNSLPFFHFLRYKPLETDTTSYNRILQSAV